MRGAALAIVVVATTSAAHADESKLLVFTERWREVPMSGELKMEERIGNNLGDLGNYLGNSMNMLTQDRLAFKFDTKRSRAKLRFGTGGGQLLRFNVDTDWHFMQDKARVKPRVELGIGNHAWKFELPNIDMATNDVYGDLAVEVRLPLFERSF